jgi:hypothetical protein
MREGVGGITMSLRGRSPAPMQFRGALCPKQSPLVTGDCFATCARNDMQTVSLRESQSATVEGLSALLPSVLDWAFKGEL